MILLLFDELILIEFTAITLTDGDAIINNENDHEWALGADWCCEFMG
jgi:hypothetical protein